MSDTELLHKSKTEPLQRLEVFTGAGRRRVWTVEQKAEIVEESYAGGETVSALARRYGLTPQQLFGWRRQVHRHALSKAATSGPIFAPVVVEDLRGAREAPAAASGPSGSYAIEFVLGAATVRIRPGIDAASLQAVLRAVKAVM